MSRFLYRLGWTCAVHRWRTVATWVLAVVVLMGLGGALGGERRDSFSVPGTESQTAFDLLSDRFPARSGASVRVVFEGDRPLTRPASAAAVARTLDNVRELDHVAAVSDPLSAQGAANLSADRRIGYAEVVYDVPPTELDATAVAALEEALEPARQADLVAAFGGDLMVEEPPSSEALGMGIAILVLLAAFGSVIAMGLPIVTAIFGLGVGMALVTVLSAIVDVNSIAPIIATMIGLAVGIDYALFIVSRHRQQLASGLGVVESIALANATAGQAVVFAGGTVMIAICGLYLAGIPFVASLGYAAAVVVAGTVAIAVTLLPALLAFAGRKIDRLRVPGLRIRHEVDPAAGSTLGARWSRLVVSRPWPFFIGSVALLLLIATPLLSLRLGQTDDGNAPPGSSRRVAYELLAKGFGPGFNGPLVVVVDLAGQQDPQSALADVHQRLAQTSGVVFVSPPVVNPAGDTALITAVPATSPQSEQTAELVSRLREDVLPAVLDADGSRAYVTGSTAAFIDVSDKITGRLPVFIGSVVLLSFLLLMASFRSILVPLKAALANLLGIGASYGVVVAVFQWGWGKGLVGLEETVPIVSFVPMMMFAILFGLSMDYEVFILSRVREEWLRTGDPRRSVVTGLASSARVVTAAAAIMVSVFGSFIVGDDPIVKMFGVGLSVAVLLDATVIRMVLVPATLALMGRANWWLPGFLDRFLPRVDVEGGALAASLSPGHDETESAAA